MCRIAVKAWLNQPPLKRSKSVKVLPVQLVQESCPRLWPTTRRCFVGWRRATRDAERSIAAACWRSTSCCQAPTCDRKKALNRSPYRLFLLVRTMLSSYTAKRTFLIGKLVVLHIRKEPELRVHYWWEWEDLGGIVTDDLKSLAQNECALQLCYNHCPSWNWIAQRWI